jgi:hypothetical protein
MVYGTGGFMAGGAGGTAGIGGTVYGGPGFRDAAPSDSNQSEVKSDALVSEAGASKDGLDE